MAIAPSLPAHARDVASRADALLEDVRILDERGFRATLVQASEAEIRSALSHAVEELEGPAGLTAEGRSLVSAWAREGVPVASLARLAAIWHASAWDAWLGAADGAGAPTAQLDRARIGSRYFIGYFDRLATVLVDRCRLERASADGSSCARRLDAVRRALAGHVLEPGTLAYDLDGPHLAFVAWGRDAAEAGHVISRDDPYSLAMPISPDLLWGWLPSLRLDEPAGAANVRARLARSNVSLAIGRRSRGRAGFSASHRQALAAREVGERLSQRLTRYDDVALEVVASADVELARGFVEDELGPLANGSSRATRLRSTLEAYFACSLNAASTGAALGVHDQTVTYRLRQIEQVVGRPIHARRAELELALRLANVVAT